ncbi:MAG: lamin tail domain-containing protein, partial [Bacteroidota bacterium]
MYTPASPEPEWVELYNPSSAAVDLSGWSIIDASGGKGGIAAGSIGAFGYVVIARDSAKLRSIRSISSPLLQAAIPSLNNSGDLVALRDGSGITIDSVLFDSSWGGTRGRSLERRRESDPAGLAASWGSSVAPTGATPGERNSLAPPGLDIAIDSLRFVPDSSAITAIIRNLGTRPSVMADILLFNDADGDGIGNALEEVRRSLVGPIDPGKSVAVSIRWDRLVTVIGERGLLMLRMPDDERSYNDTASVIISRAASGEFHAAITEIMFDPLPVNGAAGAEYIEVRNLEGEPIPIAGWTIHDGSSGTKGTIAATAPPIAPRGSVLFASDSSIYARFPFLRDSTNVIVVGVSSFSLNADGDDVVLRNAAGRTVDSVHYGAGWHRREIGDTKGIALERISIAGPSNDPRNWSSSPAPLGGTPGARNALEIPSSAVEARVSAEPPTVSPDGDGFQDFTRISYDLPSSSSRIVATAYDRYGRPVRRIANNELAPAFGELIWDGRDDAGRPLDPGIYIVRIEAYDDGGGGSFAAQATVIVARRL